MSIYGYCRISTPKQNIERQIRNILAAYPEAKLYTEKYTGRVIIRPEWDKLVKIIQPGDTVVFDSVSRMSRDAEEGVNAYMQLLDQGINLEFLKEPHINTSTYKTALQNQINADLSADNPAVNKFLGNLEKSLNELIRDLATEQIRMAFMQSEKEVEDLRQRTKEGIVTAKLNGKQPGRKQGAQIETEKSKSTKSIIEKHCKTFGGSLSDAETLKLCNCSRNSYYKYKRELIAEHNIDLNSKDPHWVQIKLDL